MKKLCILLIMLFVIACLTGCGSIPAPAAPVQTEDPALLPAEPDPASPEASLDAAEPDQGTTEASAEEAEPVPADTESTSEMEYLPDFTINTIDGTSFTLSEALQDHDLVLVNLFATWCGPCAMEFPYLQEAWSQRAEQVAVIALSIEPDDTLEVLRDYADSMGISFPMGREEGTDLERFVTVGIPTTVLVDRSGKVAQVEVGAITSTQEFLELFDGYIREDYDPEICSYSIRVFDTNYDPLAGVVINFCTDLTCVPVTTDEKGVAVFSGVPSRYHVQVIRIPEGYEFVDPDEFYTEPYGQNFLLMLRKAGT